METQRIQVGVQHIVNGLGFRIRPVLHFVLGQLQGEGDGLPPAGIEQSTIICEYLHVYFTAVVNKGQNVVKGADFAQGGQVAQQLPVEKDGFYQAVNLYPRVKGDELLVGGEKIGAGNGGEGIQQGTGIRLLTVFVGGAGKILPLVVEEGNTVVPIHQRGLIQLLQGCRPGSRTHFPITAVIPHILVQGGEKGSVVCQGFQGNAHHVDVLLNIQTDAGAHVGEAGGCKLIGSFHGGLNGIGEKNTQGCCNHHGVQQNHLCAQTHGNTT